MSTTVFNRINQICTTFRWNFGSLLPQSCCCCCEQLSELIPQHFYQVSLQSPFTPYIVLHLLPKQLNLSFISPQKIFSVVLWSVTVLFGRRNMTVIFFFCLFLERNSVLCGVLTCFYSELLLYLTDSSLLFLLSRLSWTLTSRESSHRVKPSPFVELWTDRISKLLEITL